MNWKVTGRKPTPLKAELTAGAGVGPGVGRVVVGTGVRAGVVAALPPALTAPLFKLGGTVKHAPRSKTRKTKLQTSFGLHHILRSMVVEVVLRMADRDAAESPSTTTNHERTGPVLHHGTHFDLNGEAVERIVEFVTDLGVRVQKGGSHNL